MTRGEKLLESIFGFPSMIFPSGVAAAYQLILHCRPDVIAITSSYHGVHEAIGIYRKTRGEENVVGTLSTLISRSLALWLDMLW